MPSIFTHKYNWITRNCTSEIPLYHEIAPLKDVKYVIYCLRLISSAIGNQAKVEALRKWVRDCETENKTLIILYYRHKDLPPNYVGMTKHEIFVSYEIHKDLLVLTQPQFVLEELSKILQ